MNQASPHPDTGLPVIYRRTKIIATIGPASEQAQQIKALILAGMDIARLNLSHGTPVWHQEVASRIRAIAADLNREIGILVDIPGPKLRVRAGSPPRDVRVGESILITPDVDGDATSIQVFPKEFLPKVFPGDTILVGDGAVTLQVGNSEPPLQARVLDGGTITEGMGVVIPGRRPDIPYAGPLLFTHIRQGCELDPDYIALSFVGSADDIIDARSFIKEQNRDAIPLIAKIECARAVENLSDIIQVTDGIMVARGDLGVELPIEQVPEIQKKIITRCNHQGIPVITATEMLESMLNRGRPTRAEVTDVANAIIDGSDATMLSAETSMGKNPDLAVRMMSKIACETERHLPYLRILNERAGWHEKSVEGIISYRACYIAEELDSPAIVAFTRSGLTAERVSRCRPRAPVLALTPDGRVARRLLLRWGIVPVVSSPITSAEELFFFAHSAAKDLGIAKSKDQLVIIAGNFVGKEGRTNMIKVEEIP